MKEKPLNKKGFTLVELIVSMVILSIMGTVVILSSVHIIEGFILTKMNAETSQKGHIALDRLTKEFTNIISVDSGDSTSIDFISTIDDTLGTQTVSVEWVGSGNPLTLNTDSLVDNVNDFILTYYDDYDSGASAWSTTSNEIEITLSLVGANGHISTFTSRVTPRNL